MLFGCYTVRPGKSDGMERDGWMNRWAGTVLHLCQPTNDSNYLEQTFKDFSMCSLQCINKMVKQVTD